MSKEIMVNFNQDMVRATLEGRKTQTRRPVKDSFLQSMDFDFDPACSSLNRKPYLRNGQWVYEIQTAVDDSDIVKLKTRFQPGDIMCVRERARLERKKDDCIGGYDYHFRYEADNELEIIFGGLPKRLKPIKVGHCVPNGCFRELCRIKRKVKRIWFERAQDISDEDAKTEGVKPFTCSERDSYQVGFAEAWNSIYPDTWNKNIWVEVVEFEKNNLT